ncbi:hypothetical protein [Halalkalibacter krulwichiae]|uniref:ABC-2 family transporter protein n=1 Tax=Halalkalibacter krulwichiae TaxID=199441 RepID=A0A1X9M8Y9_9BACI|nr:hypothetical protein [Halalkalibacter krulwichiae]ARK29868.1 hypothetical protein BkAM31D_08330 [Halalkalibacter krulwichiae]
MNQLIKKVATDLYSVQMKWVAWYLPIVFVVYVALLAFVAEPELRTMSLLTFTFQTATIFMLVCGILASFVFLPVYIKQGVTRKTYFKATILSSIALATTIIVITAFATWVLTFFKRYTTLFDEVVLSSLVVIEGNWFLISFAYVIVIFIYYLAGWLISLGFYRYGAAGGFGFIAISLVLIFLTDIIWNLNTPKPIVGIIPIGSFSINIGIAFILSLIIIAIVVTIVQKVTKDIAIVVE